MKTNKGLPYCIEFDTNEMPGKVVGISVELSKIIIGMTDKVNVALCEHPLYPALERYVKVNPSRPALPEKFPG